MRPFLLLVLAAVAGCASDPAPPPAAPPTRAVGPERSAPTDAVPGAPAPTGAAVALDSEGLRVVEESGSTLALSFGSAAADVTDAVTRLRGAPAERGTLDECGAGPLDYVRWEGGLTAYAVGGEFVGWTVSGPDPTLTTMTGVGVGSSRADLDAAYAVSVEETTLGTEFSAGGMTGILSGPEPGGTVGALWTGVSCVFR